MQNVKLPFGRKKDSGRLIDIDEADNGKSCNCLCPYQDCNSPLIAVQGDERQHHFRHDGSVDYECRGVEFGIYEMAKQLVMKRKTLVLPQYEFDVFAKDSRGFEEKEKEIIILQNTIANFDSIEFYEQNSDITKLNFQAIYIDKKFTIEVDLSKSKDIHNTEDLWSLINNPERVSIKLDPNDEYLHTLNNRLEEKIKAREEQYERLRVKRKKTQEEDRQFNFTQKQLFSVPISSEGYLSNLNSEQRRAVSTTEGAVLVLAGAGTGKTRVLTTRLAHLLRTGKAFPGQILSVTFTNKAAQEMKHRVSSLMGGAPVEGWWLGTFHALAARMLRRHAELVGLTSSFTILDQDDQVRLIKQLMEASSIDTKKWPPKDVANRISSWKDKGLAPSDVAPQDGGDMAGGKLLAIYSQYQQRLKTLNAADFGDLLLHMIQIFKNPANAEILADYHRRFKYILVDEYQDTNVAQYLWLRLLAKGSGNICCVGDDDQSIYGWRGAEVDNILRFEKDFPGAVVVRLEENYRSTGHILSAANAVISNNEGRLGKQLFTSEGDGEKIIVRGLWDGEAEARWVGEEIESLQNRKYGLDEMAVLVRAGFQTREFEERFIQLGLPYRVIGGPRFYERAEIRDALAYLRVVNQKDDDLALERIINTPKRGIGDSTVQTLYTHARAKNISLYDAVRDLTQTEELKPKMRGTLMKLIDDFERWRGQAENTHHSALAGTILDEAGYTDMWKMDKSPDSPGRLENLKELVSGMEEFESLPVFLEHVSLVMENANNASGEQITIMTLHGAKGLEFKCVFLPGWEEGLFPSQRSMDENGLKGLEEERRLAYVGITRARERAYISYVGNRRMYGSWINAIPSRFVDELPDEHIETNNDMGNYQAGRSAHWDSSGFSESFPLRRTSFIEGSSRRVESKPDNANINGYSRGDKVFHEKFGRGTIIHMDGTKLDIAFEKGGTKRVMDSFVTKAD